VRLEAKFDRKQACQACSETIDSHSSQKVASLETMHVRNGIQE